MTFEYEIMSTVKCIYKLHYTLITSIHHILNMVI